jgi:hypothetical protein
VNKNDINDVDEINDDGYRKIAFRVREELYAQYKIILLRNKPRINTTQDLRKYLYEVVQNGALDYNDKDFINFKLQHRNEPYIRVSVRLEENLYEKFKDITFGASTRPAYALEDRIYRVVFENNKKIG